MPPPPGGGDDDDELDELLDDRLELDKLLLEELLEELLDDRLELDKLLLEELLLGGGEELLDDDKLLLLGLGDELLEDELELKKELIPGSPSIAELNRESQWWKRPRRIPRRTPVRHTLPQSPARRLLRRGMSLL